MAIPCRRLNVFSLRDRAVVQDRDSGSGIVLPFNPQERPSYQRSIKVPGEGEALSTLQGVALLGVVDLFSSPVLLLAAEIVNVGELPDAKLFAVKKVALVRLSAVEPNEKDKAFAGVLLGLLESGGLFFSYERNISWGYQQTAEDGDIFWWSKPWTSRLGDECGSLAVQCAYGFVGTSTMKTKEKRSLQFTVISRRSRRRAGTRYLTRGADFKGDVANFVQTEQIVWDPENPQGYSSFRIIRGSIPLFWRQSNGIAKPEPELDGSVFSSRVAFTSHFKALEGRYGEVTAISLVNLHGSEKILASAFEDHMALDAHRCQIPPTLIAFDFHEKTKDSRYEEGLNELRSIIRDQVRNQKVYCPSRNMTQNGVFRVNCVDCLDRTGVVQGMISRTMLVLQLHLLLSTNQTDLSEDSELIFKRIWADNADSISKQYSGTGALKTDYTRTGKRSARGMLEDGVKSVMRIYFKNFVDGGRQDGMDVLCGYGRAKDIPMTRPPGYGFLDDCQRVTPGGEKHQVLVDLRENVMVVSNRQSIMYEFPRQGLVSWECISSSFHSPMLRLIYRTVVDISPASSPLLLQFPVGGGPLRERFLRSLLSWARPGVTSLYGNKMSVRMLATQNAPLSLTPDDAVCDILCICTPGPSGASAISAVPENYEMHGYVLVHCSQNLSLLAKKQIIPVVANPRNKTNGKAYAIAAAFSGVEICFVFTRLSQPSDLSSSVQGLKIGSYSSDISCQFDYLYIGGFVEGASWSESEFNLLANGYSSKTCDNGFFVLRGTTAEVPYTDNCLGADSSNCSGKILISEDIQGRKAPSVPSGPVHKYKAVLSGLNCSGIRPPPGIDSNIPLRTYLRFDCVLAATGVRTRLTERSSTSPNWSSETFEIDLLDSEAEQAEGSILYGQLILSQPILGDATIGYFNLPMSHSENFEKNLLLSAKSMGKVMGVLRVSRESGSTEESVLPAKEKVSMSKRGNTRAKKQVTNLLGKMSTYLSGSSGSDPFARSQATPVNDDEEDLVIASENLSVKGKNSSTNSLIDF